jgi:hypothetical protein
MPPVMVTETWSPAHHHRPSRSHRPAPTCLQTSADVDQDGIFANGNNRAVHGFADGFMRSAMLLLLSARISTKFFLVGAGRIVLNRIVGRVGFVRSAVPHSGTLGRGAALC